MTSREFWIDRASEFEAFAHKYPDIEACGDLGSSLWYFWGLPPGAEDDFKIAAENAARGLLNLDVRKLLWCQWLDFVRDFTLNRDWGFGLMEYTMPESRKKRPSELRLERFCASLPDGPRTDFERTQLREFERAALQEQAQAFQEEPGIIKSVFESSARVCRELAARTSESEWSKSGARRSYERDPSKRPGEIPSAAEAQTPTTMAEWLVSKLKERDWNKHDVQRHEGPNHKTVQKILDGKQVRAGVLDNLSKTLSKKGATVHVADIPPVRSKTRKTGRQYS